MSNFHINVTEISEEDRKRALSATEEFLKKIDVQQIDQMRRQFELPPESIGFLVNLYVSKLKQPSMFPVSYAGETRADREVLPISTLNSEAILDMKLPKGNVLPEQIVSIKVPVKSPFHPSQLVVSNAGTAGGAADWIICDIKFDDKSQFLQNGAIPGDLFATNATNTFVRWQMCRTQAEVIVQYIGLNEKGCRFFGSLVGEGNIDTKKVEEAPRA